LKPLPIVSLKPMAGKSGDQHGKIIVLRFVVAPKGLIMDPTIFHLGDPSAQNPRNATIFKDHFHNLAGLHDMAAIAHQYAIHAKITKIVFVGNPCDFGHIPDLVPFQYLFDVQNVFECGPLASSLAMTRPDQYLGLLPLFHLGNQALQGYPGFLGMGIGTNGMGLVLSWRQPWGSFEIEFWARCIDQVIIGDLFLVPLVITGDIGRHYIWFWLFFISFGMEAYRFGLFKANVFSGIQRCQGEQYILGLHSPSAHPNIGRDPLVVAVGGNYHYFMLLGELSSQMGCCDMTRNTSTQ